MKTYHIFISHSWSYSDSFYRLKNLLDRRPYFSYIDHSVSEESPIHTSGNDTELYNAILRKIRFCHIVLVMGGVYSTHSRWINMEIQAAKTEFRKPKPIIGIRPWGQIYISSAVSNNVDALVNWNTESIVSAIRCYAII